MKGKTETEVSDIAGEHSKEVMKSPGTQIENPEINNAADILKILVQKDAPMDMIKEFITLQNAQEDRAAKQAYNTAMAKFSQNPPEILKTKHVSFLDSKQHTVEWWHAELGEICEAIVPRLGEYGLFPRWVPAKKDKNVFVTCVLTHAQGHSEEVTMDGPPDTSGNKDALKAFASTNTILQRLTLLSITGLAAKGMDQEQPSNGMVAKFISDEQVETLKKTITETGADVDKFLKFAGILTLDTMPESMFQDAIKELKKKGKARKNAEDEPGTDG